ncbi:unnamed protein product [Lota lota]
MTTEFPLDHRKPKASPGYYNPSVKQASSILTNSNSNPPCARVWREHVPYRSVAFEHFMHPDTISFGFIPASSPGIETYN